MRSRGACKRPRRPKLGTSACKKSLRCLPRDKPFTRNSDCPTSTDWCSEAYIDLPFPQKRHRFAGNRSRERAVKILIWIALLSFTLYAIACSTIPREPTGPHAPLPVPTSTSHAKLAPQLPEAPTGFDNKSNGVADGPTHAADQTKFEQIEAISDGLGPLFNAQSCGECHQSPVTGGASHVMELRVGHTGPDGKFQNAEIPINHGSEIIKGRTLVNLRAICPNAAFPSTEIQERVPDSETIRTFRKSLSILGDGFVEAIADSTLTDISDKQCKQEHGRICRLVLYVPIL